MILDHVNIRAPMELLERERDFLCDVLGLREGSRPNFGFRGFWLYAGDQPVVHLSESAGGTRNAGHGAIDHVAFRSTGVEDLVRALAAGNVEYSTAYLPDLDMTQVFFRSPTGTRIEVNFVKEQL